MCSVQARQPVGGRDSSSLPCRVEQCGAVRCEAATEVCKTFLVRRPCCPSGMSGLTVKKSQGTLSSAHCRFPCAGSAQRDDYAASQTRPNSRTQRQNRRQQHGSLTSTWKKKQILTHMRHDEISPRKPGRGAATTAGQQIGDAERRSKFEASRGSSWRRPRQRSDELAVRFGAACSICMHLYAPPFSCSVTEPLDALLALCFCSNLGIDASETPVRLSLSARRIVYEPLRFAPRFSLRSCIEWLCLRLHRDLTKDQASCAATPARYCRRPLDCQVGWAFCRSEQQLYAASPPFTWPCTSV